jgi:hypothetical protein
MNTNNVILTVVNTAGHHKGVSGFQPRPRHDALKLVTEA